MLQILALALAPLPLAEAAEAPTSSKPVDAYYGIAVEPPPAPTPALAQEEEEEEPKNEWVGMFTFGLAALSGNTETTSVATTADARYTREKDRTTLSAFLNWSEEKTGGSNRVTEQKYGGKAQYDYFFSEKTYGLATTRVEHDKLADLDYRIIAGVGLGRQIKDEEALKLSGEAGLSYFIEEFTDDDNNYLALRLAYNLGYTFSEKTSFLQFFEIYPDVSEIDNYYLKLDSRLATSLTDAMFAQLQWVLDYNSEPQPGTKNADNRIQVTVGWGF